MWGGEMFYLYVLEFKTSQLTSWDLALLWTVRHVMTKKRRGTMMMTSPLTSRTDCDSTPLVASELIHYDKYVRRYVVSIQTECP